MQKPFKVVFITLFPELYKTFIAHSIIKKAIDEKRVIVETVNLRNFGIGKHKMVDDYQYGPGSGMILMIEPLYNAIMHAKKMIDNPCVILMSPQGKILEQQKVVNLANSYSGIIIISGNYEGFDERIRKFIDLEISIGDYILTGGELPSLILANTVIRVYKGVIKNESLYHESFTNGILDYPVYTKPRSFKNHDVPEILLSGHHQKIKIWRREMALSKTKKKRYDLFLKWEKKQNKNQKKINN